MAELISATGTLSKMIWQANVGASDAPGAVEPRLPVGETLVPLKAGLGARLSVRFLGEIHCQHCGRKTRKSYSQGYCYPCFKKLARCDLCIVSPTRCHFAEGTCREPEWAQGFCFAPHSVYLANSSGLKVGITGKDRETSRWLDQGARQALVFAHCESRQLAGEIEARLSESLSDRTDWRRLVTGDTPLIDLEAARERARVELGALPAGATLAPAAPAEFLYPVARYGPARSISLDKSPEFASELWGIKGQYLLCADGALNVRKHTGYRVELSLRSEPGGAQLEIF
ncbi:MAG: DUF2797 domain-containing protein [Pseudomonadota bacterium]